jgi:hypothetical protein
MKPRMLGAIDTADCWLACPDCGGQWGLEVGAGDMRAHDPGDEYDPNNPLGLRGPWWELLFPCSMCGSTVQLVLSRHKGGLAATTLTMANQVPLGVPEEDIDPAEQHPFARPRGDVVRVKAHAPEPPWDTV